jgi:hypothetical protein
VSHCVCRVPYNKLEDFQNFKVRGQRKSSVTKNFSLFCKIASIFNLIVFMSIMFNIVKCVYLIEKFLKDFFKLVTLDLRLGKV